MRNTRPCGVRVTLSLVVLATLAIAPSFAHAQVLTLVQSGVRYAGSNNGTAGFNGDFGAATSVNLNAPSYIVFDSLGNEYLSDTQNNCVRKIDTSGNISTVVGLASSGDDTCNTTSNSAPTFTQGLFRPTGLAIDSANRLYISDSMHNCVRSLAYGYSGVANLTTVAGTCGPSSNLSNTPIPNGLALDSSNNLYISLQDSISATPVYQVVKHAASDTTPNVCLVAGAASVQVPNACPGITNGISLASPSGLALDANGDLFIADTGNNCVREVAGLTTQQTAVGQCLNDHTGNPATTLHAPYGLALSPTQSLFITESAPDNVLSYVIGSNTLTLAAGLPSGLAGAYNSAQDGKSALNAPLNGPRGIAADSFGNFSVADSSNNITRKLSNNIIFPNTPVGSPSSILPITFVVNQNVNLSATSGPDFSITSNTCTGHLAPAASGAPPTTCQVFVRFTPTRPGLRDSSFRLVDATSGTTIMQGLQATGTGALNVFTPGIVNTVAASLAAPTAITVDSAGDAYVLQRGTSPGTASVLLIPAGGGATQTIIPQGAGLLTPSAIALDAAGNYFIADAAHGTIARYGADGSINTSYITGLDTPTAVHLDGFGNLFIAQAGVTHNVIEVYAGGLRHVIAGSGANTAADGVFATTASFVAPSALFLDLNGTLYIADAGGHLIYAVDKSGIIHQVAGNGTTTTTVPGQATGTALIAPSSLSVDAAGDIYIADSAANRIYTVFASSSSIGENIATVLGTGVAGNTGDGGYGNLARINNPLSVAVDGSANLFVVDSGNSSVREITYPSPTIDFGTVMVGQTSPVMLQSLSNFGTDNLGLTTPFSTSDSHFVVVDTSSTTCGTTIITGSTCSLGFTFTPTTNGPVTATSTLVSNSYNSPQPIQLTAIGKQLQPLQFTLPPQTEVYGQPFPETVNITNGNPAPTGTITFSLGKIILCTLTATLGPTTTCNAPSSGLSVGTYPVTFTYSGDTNYSPASGPVALTVTPAPLTVSINNVTRLYGAPNPAFTGALTGTVSGDTILVAYSTTATIISPVGAYPITATLTAAGNTDLANYTITNTPGTLTITQATLTVNVASATRQYGQANPAFTSTMAGALNGDTFAVSYSTTATITSPVGAYPITATVSGANAASYNVVVAPGTLTITTAPLTITVANATRAYGTPNPAFTSTVTGALNGDTFINTYSTTATITSPVGTYPINDGISGPAASNYSITVTPGILTITRASINLNVAANNATRTYGAANPIFSSTITGALNGDTFTVSYATTATSASPVGTYPIVPTVSGTATANYNITTTNGTLSVTPATLTVTANNATRAYGTANPTFTGVTSGLLNEDTVTTSFSTTATTNSPVGAYPILPAASGTALSNYTVVAVNGTLTITQAVNPLIINVDSKARLYGQPNPTLTGNYSGVLPGDNVIVTYTTAATPASAAGKYAIGANVSGTSAGNYIATIHPGTLAISAAATVTTVATSGSPATVGANVTFTATVTTAVGVPVGLVSFSDGATVLGTQAVNATGVATLTTATLALGSHPITATFLTTTNFTTSAASLTQTIVAPTGSFTLTATNPTQYIKGAGTTIYQLTLTSVGAFAGQVALSCSGLPADATCSFGSNPTLTAGGTATATMTVTIADARLSQPSNFNPANLAPITAAAVFPFELTGLGVFFAGFRRRKTLGTQKMRLLLLILCTLGILGLAGCGCPSTTFKTYTINVTGTSVTFAAPAQTTSVVLSVGNQ